MIFRSSYPFFPQKLDEWLTRNTDLCFGRNCPDVPRVPSALSPECFQLCPNPPLAHAEQKHSKHWQLDSLEIAFALFIIYSH